MTPDDRDHLLLAAYLDGELSPGETIEMQRRLETDPELSRLRDELAGLSAAIRTVVAETEIAPGFAERVSPRVRAENARPRPWKLGAWPSMAAALLIGFAAGGPLGYAISRHAGTPGETALADAIVANHLRGLAAPQPFDVASSDRHTVKPWFNGRTAIAPDAPDLTAQGYPLVGGRVDIVEGRTVPTLVYRRRQHVISVTVVPRVDDGANGAARHEGTNIQRWDAEDLTYVATSDLNARELGDFASTFRAATAPR